MSDAGDLLESPRKRQKLSANSVPQLDGAMDEALPPDADSAITKPANDPSVAEMEAQKERDVGITEYVSPDAMGFSGILKKRLAN